MIDLHTHILPGLDDGAEDLSDALAMAELALEGGVDTLVATPHSNQAGRFDHDAAELLPVFARFQAALAEAQLPLRTFLGMEIFAAGDLEAKIRRGSLVGLNRSRYYLVEFAFDEDSGAIGDYLDQIFSAGGIPLIAHPERYFCVQEHPVLVYEWLWLGCLAQVNKGSLFGKFGRRAARAADVLVHNRLATCVASDAHSPYTRTTYMKDAWEYLSDRFGEREAHRLLEENPARILRGQRVPPHGTPPEQRRKIFF